MLVSKQLTDLQHQLPLSFVDNIPVSKIWDTDVLLMIYFPSSVLYNSAYSMFLITANGLTGIFCIWSARGTLKPYSTKQLYWHGDRS